MKSNLCQIFDFPFFDTHNGLLCMFQGHDVEAENKLPFVIKRVLVMKDMKPGDARGGHTHHKTRQVLVAISGACIIELDNGKHTEQLRLDAFNQALLLEPYVWHVMKDFAPNTVLLVLADTAYNETDYIRNYQEFLRKVARTPCDVPQDSQG